MDKDLIKYIFTIGYNTELEQQKLFQIKEILEKDENVSNIDELIKDLEYISEILDGSE